MKNKKSEKANLENKKGMFFLIGLVVALGTVLLAFEWKTEPNAAIDLGNATFTPAEFVYIPPTPNEKKEIPIQKIEVPFFELVDNESDVETDMDVFDSEANDDTFIDFNSVIFQKKENKNDKVDEIFFFVDEMPEFPGGEKALLKYLGKNVKYPVIAQENGIQGKVFVSFVIDKNGLINDVELIRGVDVSIDNEALRVVRSMPKWKAGKQGGYAVKVRYNVPILFELQ